MPPSAAGSPSGTPSRCWRPVGAFGGALYFERRALQSAGARRSADPRGQARRAVLHLLPASARTDARARRDPRLAINAVGALPRCGARLRRGLRSRTGGDLPQSDAMPAVQLWRRSRSCSLPRQAGGTESEPERVRQHREAGPAVPLRPACRWQGVWAAPASIIVAAPVDAVPFGPAQLLRAMLVIAPVILLGSMGLGYVLADTSLRPLRGHGRRARGDHRRPQPAPPGGGAGLRRRAGPPGGRP